MTSQLKPITPSTFSLSPFIRALKGRVIAQRQPKFDECLFGHMVRMARLSPHLLADIGFTEKREPGACGKTFWCKGNLRVIIDTDTMSISICPEQNSE